MIYQRGQREDYDRWARAGNAGWDWKSVKYYFNKHLDYSAYLHDAEDKSAAEEEYGVANPTREWKVNKPQIRWDILDNVLDAVTELGIPTVDHFNNSNVPSAGYFQVNQVNGLRLSCYRAFLDPVKKRSNLTVISHAQVRVMYPGVFSILN